MHEKGEKNIRNMIRNSHSLSLTAKCSTASKCNEFADYFKEKTANIRSSICQRHNATTAEETSSIQCEALLDNFSLVDAEMLREVVTKLKSSTCTQDPVPTSFFKNVFNSVSEEVLTIFSHLTTRHTLHSIQDCTCEGSFFLKK